MGCVAANGAAGILAAALNVFGNEHSHELCVHAAKPRSPHFPAGACVEEKRGGRSSCC